MSNKKIKLRFDEDIEPQEIFLDSLAEKKEEEMGVARKKIEVPINGRGILFFYGGFALVAMVFIAQSAILQIIERDENYLKSELNRTRTFYTRSARGVIYDQFKEQLAYNRLSFDLIYKENKQTVVRKERREKLEEVAKIYPIDVEEIDDTAENKLKNRNDQIIVIDNIPEELLVIFQAKIESSQLPGFSVEKNSVREYVDGPSYSQVIGYTGRIGESEKNKLSDYISTDYLGKSGIEKTFEAVLRGKPGIQKVIYDAKGSMQSEGTASISQPGNSIILWLDSGLQKKAEKALSESLDRVGAKSGVIVAMDPRSGGILSLVSLPNFDNNLFIKGASSVDLNALLHDQRQPLFNRAISGNYPSGSTIKPLIAAAALEEKTISPDKQIEDIGYITVPNPWDPEKSQKFMDNAVHGTVDMRKAIAVSCNVYFYTIGGGYGDQVGLGPLKMDKYLRLFGWGNKTNVDLSGEKRGLLPDPEWKKATFTNDLDKIWRDGDTYNMSIGQGYLLATPIQVVTSFAAIANGGILYKPQIVKEIIDNDNNGVEVNRVEVPKEIVRENFIDKANLEVVRQGMRAGVTYGSSISLNSLPVTSAAKTGTAQTSRPNYYHNWVTVFAPYDNPKIVITVLIENVKDLQVAALPVAKEILEWYFLQPQTQ
ncbi:MAG: penicillin-binding protein 2 [bacterium]